MKALIQFNIEECKKAMEYGDLIYKLLHVDKLPEKPIVMKLSECRPLENAFVLWDEKHRYGVSKGITQYTAHKKYKVFDVIMSVPD